jgi:iron-sulfur cluster assembly accessory protein
MVKLTESAAAAVRVVLAAHADGAVGIRLAVASGGCSELRYTMSLAARARADDKLIESSGVAILVDPASASLLEGTVVDFEEGPDEPGFVFDNPNATGCRGCERPSC